MGTKLFLYWVLNLHEWEEPGNLISFYYRPGFCQIPDLINICILSQFHLSSLPAGIEDLFGSLGHIQSRLRTIEDQQDVAFLNKLFQNSRFQHALNIHNKVSDHT